MEKNKSCNSGGSSVPVIKGELMMNTNLDYESIFQAGSMLGSGAIIIMDEDTDMVKFFIESRVSITRSHVVNAVLVEREQDGCIDFYQKLLAVMERIMILRFLSRFQV